MPPITPLAVLAASGETSYISKHNDNYETIEAALNIVLDRTATMTTTANAIALDSILGEETAFIGTQSMTETHTTTTMTVAVGFGYKYSVHTALKNLAATVLDFAGNGAGTLYVRQGADGTPQISTSATDALYTVVWSGTVFTSVTRSAPIVWGEVDFSLAQTSAALADTFDRLVDRLEAAETATQAMFTQAITTADVTPAPADVMQHGFFVLTGALTGNRAFIVPASEKFLAVQVNCTGAYTVTVKTAAGTGIALSPGQLAHLYCDGTNVLDLSSGGQYLREIPTQAGTYTANQDFLGIPIAVDQSFPTNLAGSKFRLTVAPADGNWVLRMMVDGVQVGTITFATGTTTAPTISLTALAVLEDEFLQLLAPSTPDSAAAGLSATIVATKGA